MNSKLTSPALGFAALSALAGCSNVLPEGFTITDAFTPRPQVQTSTPPPATAGIPVSASPRAKECLMRAMYFESNRSSEAGMLAVGTVVMNRVSSPKFDNDICSVVGAPRQFAPGVLSREMTEERPVALASAVADRVLSGERHAGVQTAKFFHTQGLTFPYTNMHYVLNAGGNSFYIKRSRR
ncbi:MAG TPA: cell wall hydrolase [Devosia sp.]|nr:cell wall hydrolase [Devosia sp.]